MSSTFCDASTNTDISISYNAIVNADQIKNSMNPIERVDYNTYNRKHKFIVPTILYGDNKTIIFKYGIINLGNIILEFPNLKKISFAEAVDVQITSTFNCPDTLETFATFGNKIISLELVKFNTGLKNLLLVELSIRSLCFIRTLIELEYLELTDNQYITTIDTTLPKSLCALTIHNCPIENIDTIILPDSLRSLHLSDFEIKNKFPPMTNSLVHLNISRTNTTSIDFLPIMPNLNSFTFNESQTCITDREERNANQIDILDLAKFPALNSLIASYAGIKKIINYENNTFLELIINNNKISDFTGWKFARNTECINIGYNLIESINDNQWPDFISDIFSIANNEITHLPLSLIYINVQCKFYYYSCPIENLNDPIIKRWINCNFKSATIYNNLQNVHDGDIVESIKQSILNLAKLPKIITKSIHSDILNNETVHSIYKLTECEIAVLVENCIATKKETIQQELHAILREAINEGRDFCLTGRISRIINVLSGFDDNVVIKIGNSEQIANVILAHQKRNAPHEELIAALKELQMTDEEIDTWLGSCAPQNP